MSRWVIGSFFLIAAAATASVSTYAFGETAAFLRQPKVEKDLTPRVFFVAGERFEVAGVAEAQQKAPTAAGEGETFGTWKLSCPGSDPCRLAQSVVVGEKRELLLTARAYKGPEPVLVVSLPQGIYLAPGLALQIGTGKSRRYPFETCMNDGCHSGLKLDNALLAELSAGKDAKLSFYDGAQKVITVLLTLDGFKEGYDAMK